MPKVSDYNIGASQENPIDLLQDSDDDAMMADEQDIYTNDSKDTYYSASLEDMQSDESFDNYNDDDDIFSGDSGNSDDDMFHDRLTEEVKYKVNFAAKDVDKLRIMQKDTVNQVATLLAIRPHISTILLNYFCWNKEKLIETYIEDPDKVLVAAGIHAVSKSSNNKGDCSASFECEICCNDESGLQTVSLTCGHLFCVDCYSYYLSDKVKQGDATNIQCPQEGCKAVVDEATLKIVLNDDMYIRYQSLLDKAYVQDHPNLKWCTAPDCKYAIECDISRNSLSTIVPTVTCECGHVMCFGCDHENHQPANCAMVKDWWRKKEEDSATATWISSHTKDCPQCQSPIEKNGGCNHMWCKQCKHEFCWVCLGDWKTHNGQAYNCNRYTEDTAGLSKKRASLERYLHYWTRYANHQNSSKLDQALYHKTESSMLQVQNTSDLTWIEVQFFKRAVDLIVQSRNTLKWSYVMAYYMEKTNQKTIFEDNQRDLEVATEQLSELLETPIQSEDITDLRKRVLDKSVYVGQRQNTLISDTAKGLYEGRWELKRSEDL
ncbi:RING-5 like protein [Mucor ambiguus]|uniref:RBR-type E3 ubiquitin transferase n=1 Tax=Mucor ambiguus TaxID=91626 RepID=A0A0C9MWQ6_9FUNG|nr:RING-5 like protein [Mucor ambiguus]